MKITLGKRYKDKITGFEGVATGYVTYLTGCNQALLAPTVSNDGALRDSHWVDEQRLTELEGDPITLDNATGVGFDKAAPIR